MINFNLFVLPFSIGLLYLLFTIGQNWYRWIRSLPVQDKARLRAGIRHPGLWLDALREVLLEGLIHRKLWQRNPLLGYMHMSFALGWFLLIVFGNLESRYYSGTHLNAPYYPIFLKFFIHDPLVLFFEVNRVPGFFRFIMDLLLLFVLSGLLLAFLKRKQSRWFGMTRSTEHALTDRVAMAALWLIFPMRLVAESFTAGYYGSGGGFLTQPLGNFLVRMIPLPDDFVAYTLWWGYSMVLGLFFVAMPYSRYMHIPTEILLIFFRHFGIRPKRWYSSYSDTEVHSCSRCGVCIDVCQMNGAGIRDAQAVYFIRGVRDQFVPEEVTRQCLLCGRCQEVCPVAISTDSLRLIKRRELYAGQTADFGYIPREIPDLGEVAYFSGCMTHLTPSVITSMKEIMKKAGVNYVHLDHDRSICCGRPLKIAGKDLQAGGMIEANSALIRRSGAKLLVTSCPICYRVFKEDYALNIRVLHHTEFLLELIRHGRIPLQTVFRKAVYHDPCDLGRGSRVYQAPREVLAKITDLVNIDCDGSEAMCCGGSLGMLQVSQQQRDVMTREALKGLVAKEADVLVTACPLCKKSFARHSDIPVKDIAELVSASIPA